MMLNQNNEVQHQMNYQVIDYGFVSLVSDFGGTLGLFVGFSFFALWDLFKDFAIVLGYTFK